MEQRPLPREASSRARATSYRMMEDDHTEVEERASVGFDITEIVDSRKFPSGNVERTSSSAFSLTSMVTTGFRNPMLFEEHRHLGLVVPDPTFTVSDVERLVGSNRVLDVMDCSTQEALAMKMRDWTMLDFAASVSTLVDSLSFSPLYSCMFYAANKVHSPRQLLQRSGQETTAKCDLARVQSEQANAACHCAQSRSTNRLNRQRLAERTQSCSTECY